LNESKLVVAAFGKEFLDGSKGGVDRCLPSQQDGSKKVKI